MQQIDPKRVELAAEFKAKPFGVHSADLHVVLNLMRRPPLGGRHVLLVSKPHEAWVLAEMDGKPPRPRRLENCVFDSLEAAEWFVFKLRWRELTGAELDIE